MLEVTFEDANTLRKITDAVKDLVDDVTINAGPNGISLQAMDGTHVALVSLDLKDSGFQDYRSDQNFEIGIRLKQLYRILKISGRGDSLTLNYKADASTLSLKFVGEDQEANFDLNLFNLNSESLQIPTTSYNARIMMNSGYFSKICKDLEQMAENVKIEANSKSIIFSVEGETTAGRIERKKGGEGENAVHIDCEEPISNSFSLSFLNIFNKAAALTNQVILSFNEDSPLVVEFTMGDTGSLKFYLAPKINED